MSDIKRYGDNYIVEASDEAAFIARMQELAKSYTPEWNMDVDNPDIAATLALIYAKQLADNGQRINQTIDKYHTAFINLLDITARKATSADGILVMDVAYETIDGINVPKGSKFGASPQESKDAEAASEIVFETQHDLYVTGAGINTIFATDVEDGSIIEILGKIETADILNRAPDDRDNTNIVPEEEDYESKELIASDQPFVDTEDAGIISPRFKPFTLFGKGKSLAQNACMLYHSIIFDTVENDIFIKIEGCQPLIDDLVSKKLSFRYPVKDRLIPVEKVELLEDGATFRLKKEKPADKQLVGSARYSAIAIFSEDPIVKEYTVDKITISSASKAKAPEFVGNGTTDFEVDRFLPFGEEISYLAECYIGADETFSKAGATITLNLKLQMLENMVRLSAVESSEALKIIRRKPKDDWNINPADVFADTVAFEYFNGIGWKRIPFAQDFSQLFSTTAGALLELKFICPLDWKSTTVGGYDGRSIRITVTKADNCYMRPALHHYPKITELKIKYDYDDRFEIPEQLVEFAGVSKNSMTELVKKYEKYPVLSPTGFNQDALYIGFDEKPKSGPVGIMFKLDERLRYDPLPITFEYSTRTGFKSLKVLDETNSMSHSGVMYFIPPADFAEMRVAGKKQHFIRVLRKNVQVDMEQLPVIENIIINGVKISNIDSKEEQEFYIDEILPNTVFDLGYSNILNTDVWVNEAPQLSMVQMRDMLNHEPDRCYAEYDISGNISQFFIKWEEIDNFAHAKSKRVYVLDRLESKLIFGDGVNTEIPRALEADAVRVKSYVCVGERANVPAEAIGESVRGILYLGTVTNPVKAYGGSNMESLHEALIRGENIIATRKRLVSKKDYLTEINSFSDVIDQAAIVTDIRPDNKSAEGAISICLLMKDFEDGAYSFHRIVEPLKKYLLSCCETTINAEDLFICEPVFVELSVTVWANSISVEDNFYLQSTLHEILDGYFNPLKSMGGPFKIGTMPTVDQIRMRLNTLKNKMVIDNISVLAKYKDENGLHELSLEELQLTPFMIVKNGQHQIR